MNSSTVNQIYILNKIKKMDSHVNVYKIKRPTNWLFGFIMKVFVGGCNSKG